jgi:protein-S-isoprenylcysteine O-methyltransferase Ste14
MKVSASNGADRASRVPWPPILQAAILIAAWVLGMLLPLQVLPDVLVMRCAGLLVFVLGMCISIAGMRYFKSIGTSINPTGAAQKLADRGIYAWTRNPMYLGVTIAFIGLAFGLASTWLLILALLMPFALKKLAIDPEEAYLGRRFGTAYTDYCARVPRWI